jgi:hypothetical protein
MHAVKKHHNFDYWCFIRYKILINLTGAQKKRKFGTCPFTLLFFILFDFPYVYRTLNINLK